MHPGRQLRRPAAGWSIALLAVLLPCLACGDGSSTFSPATDDPHSTALALFELASRREPTPDDLAQLFGSEVSAEPSAALLDSLSDLAEFGEPRIDSMQELRGPDFVATDLIAALPGGGSATLSVHLERSDAGAWKVTSFAGPGIEWPPARRRRGEALTTSSPPGETRP